MLFKPCKSCLCGCGIMNHKLHIAPPVPVIGAQITGDMNRLAGCLKQEAHLFRHGCKSHGFESPAALAGKNTAHMAIANNAVIDHFNGG